MVCGVCGVCGCVWFGLSVNFARGTMPVTPTQIPKEASTDSAASSASTHAGSPVPPASPTMRTLTFSEAPSNPHALKQPALALAAIRHFDALRKRLDAGDNPDELKAEIDFYEQQLREPRDYKKILNDSIADAEALVVEEGLSAVCVELAQDLLKRLKLEIEVDLATAASRAVPVESSAVPTISAQPVAALGSFQHVYPPVPPQVAAARQQCVELARECQSIALGLGKSLDATEVKDLKAKYPTVLMTRNLDLPDSNPKTKYASWLVTPKRCKLTEACPDIANDVPGFTLKAQGYKNEQWPEVLRVLQFVGLYEAYRALLDASTPASAGTSGQ